MQLAMFTKIIRVNGVSRVSRAIKSSDCLLFCCGHKVTALSLLLNLILIIVLSILAVPQFEG